MKYRVLCILLLLSGHLFGQEAQQDQFLNDVEHGYASNGDVSIHYATIGDGPLVIMLHGFPDYWYTWRDQMTALKDQFQLVAIDLRGYNLSSQPEGVENYKMKHLMDDVIAVIRSLGQESAIIAGHDWGGGIAWQLAIHHPAVVEKLIVCNITHPTGQQIESLKTLQSNGNTSYTDDFRKQTSETLPISWLTGWVKDAKAKPLYEKAFSRSSIDAMINYYKANTPTKDERAVWLENPTIQEMPKVTAPVLVIFGTKDQFIRKEGLNNTWDWIDGDLTLVTLPNAGHFVLQDASDMVSKSMLMWLLRDE